MSGRGRGRGGRGGNNKSFSREQLSSLGVTGNEVLPGPVTQPPPLFPMLLRRPVPITQNLETDYLLMLKQDLIDNMNMSAAYLKMPEKKDNHNDKEIDNLLAQLPRVTKEKFDWSLFPSELRPKLLAKRVPKKKVVIKKEIDVETRLEELQQIEEKTAVENSDVVVKTEVEDEDALGEEEVEYQEEEDEEMDDGTDYANNYFDNGEEYEDEDDNLDDGPIY